MKTSVQVTADAAPWPELVDSVVAAESLGVDAVWVAEAWGSDAASPLGCLAARTSRVTLGAAVFQVGARSAVMAAQTALTLNEMSPGRFVLGLGVSGPQVMEGLHGVRFADPVGRMAETLDVIEQAFAGERIAYEGRHLRLPLPDGMVLGTTLIGTAQLVRDPLGGVRRRRGRRRAHAMLPARLSKNAWTRSSRALELVWLRLRVRLRVRLRGPTEGLAACSQRGRSHEHVGWRIHVLTYWTRRMPVSDRMGERR